MSLEITSLRLMIRVWEVASGKCIQTLDGHSDNVNAVSMGVESAVVVGTRR